MDLFVIPHLLSSITSLSRISWCLFLSIFLSFYKSNLHSSSMYRAIPAERIPIGPFFPLVIFSICWTESLKALKVRSQHREGSRGTVKLRAHQSCTSSWPGRRSFFMASSGCTISKSRGTRETKEKRTGVSKHQQLKSSGWWGSCELRKHMSR